MTSDQHAASSADTVVPRNYSEKASVELPTSDLTHRDEHAQEQGVPPEKEQEVEDAVGRSADDELEKKPSGPPLDRTPSQAQRMGKKQITVVMVALCVRAFILLRRSGTFKD